MTDTLQRYPEYKDSGLPWLGKIPVHWEIKRAKSIFQRIDQRSKTGKEELLTVSSARGIVPRKTASVTMFKAESYLGYKLCWPGDLVINSLWAWGGGLGVSNHHGIISSAYGVYRIRQDTQMSPAFVHQVVRSSSFNWELQVRSKGVWISRLQLTDVSFLDAPFFIPPPDEQAAIVRFLDHANGRIERAIRAKRKIITLLNEQKQAIIRRAVTRGLDPSVPLKPSGIPWLGDIPAHWEVKRLKSIAAIRYGLGQPPRESETGLPIIRATNVDHGKILTRNLIRVDPADVPKSRNAFLKEGEIIVVRSGALTADSAIIPKAYEGSVAGYDMVVTVKRALPDFIALVLLCSYVEVDQLIIASMRAAQPHLNAEELGTAVILLPPADEQPKIVEKVRNEHAPLITAISNLEREITLLREYRTRLTADVVTGKLDVRAAAASLPDPEPVESVLSVSPDEPGAADESDLTPELEEFRYA